MTKEEAKAYLQWFKSTYATYLYLASWPNQKPFCIEHPDSSRKKAEAQVVLGVHEYQNSYERLKERYPNLTVEKYNEIRIKNNIK